MHGPVVRLPVSTLLVIHSGCHTISPEVVPLLTSTSSTLIANTTLISNTRLIILSSTLSGALTGLPAVSVITLASLKLHASSYGPWGENYYWPTIDLVPVCGCPSQVTLSSGIVLPYTLILPTVCKLSSGVAGFHFCTSRGIADPRRCVNCQAKDSTGRITGTCHR